jgi:signal transduction histidine kinase/DNA-binding NarL/FixJ family response regulator
MPGTILVAEDDPEARELLTLLLGGGYQVLHAADGVEAIDILKREEPDLLITDIVMPNMDGYELVRRVRQDERTANLPVIFCSASYHEREVREMARSLGVANTLAKPYQMENVRDVVAAAMASKVGLLPERFSEAMSPDAVARVRGAQERLNAMVAFSRHLFSEDGPAGIARCASHAAREILLAQCAQVYVGGKETAGESCIASGLAHAELRELLASQMYRQLRTVVEEGGSAMFPMSSSEAADSAHWRSGDFVSMLGVPISSSTKTYGYLSVINRIGLAAFTDEDLGIARAIAAQVAMAYENAVRRRELEAEVARRSEMEKEVRRLNRELEARVKQRTGELERANRELEAFSYSVAHDLRAPLRLIDAQAQMLAAGGMGKLQRPVVVQLEQIRRGAEHMSALIDGLLTLSRVRYVEMNPAPVPLGMIVSRAIEILEPQTADRQIEWHIGTLPQVTCDDELMLQVVVNLISNAIKYSRPRPNAIIEIGFESGATPHIYVRDNGVGFDMRYAPKLFGLFQRLHRQDEFEGTGIGLATVSRIIERHGGKVWAESKPGEGAVFRFTVPGLKAS